jgi:cytochrome c biogenesis protein CcmG/thiol:disulfide interchange protein DsbE
VKRWIATLPLAVLVGLAALFALHLRAGTDPHYVPTATVGKPMPSAVLPQLSGGGTASLATAAPPATLVNFFASWCAPCIEETPTLLALKAQGVRIVGVAWKDDPDKTRAMLARLGDPYATVLVDRAGGAGLDFGVSGVPETYVIGAGGRVLAKEAAPLTPESAERLIEAADAGR